MANYGIQPPDYGGFLGGWQQSEAFSQEMQDRQLMGQMNRLQLQSAQENLAIQRATRLGLMQSAERDAAPPMGSVAMPGAPATGPMGAPLPTPEQLAAKEVVDSGKPADIADFQPAAPQALKFAGLPDKPSDAHLGEWNKAKADEQMYRRAGNMAEVDKARQAAEVALGKRTAALENERKDQRAVFENVGNMLGGVKDQTSLNDTLAFIAATYPQSKQLIAGLKLPQDRDGQYVWNDQSKGMVGAIGEAMLKSTDRMKREEFKQQEEDRKQRLLDQQKRDDDNAEFKRATVANAREGLAIRRDILDARRDQQQQAQAAKVVKDVNADLNKNPVYKTYPQIEAAKTYGDQIVNQLAEGKSIDAPQARALLTQYKNVAEGMRNHVGGRYEMQDMKAFNGAIQTVQKWVTSVGEGTPAVDKSTARNVANAISQMYGISNKVALTETFRAMEKVDRGGGDVRDVNQRGNLQYAINTGAAAFVDKAGNKVKDISDAAFLQIGSEKFPMKAGGQ